MDKNLFVTPTWLGYLPSSCCVCFLQQPGSVSVFEEACSENDAGMFLSPRTKPQQAERWFQFTTQKSRITLGKRPVIVCWFDLLFCVHAKKHLSDRMVENIAGKAAFWTLCCMSERLEQLHYDLNACNWYKNPERPSGKRHKVQKIALKAPTYKQACRESVLAFKLHKIHRETLKSLRYEVWENKDGIMRIIIICLADVRGGTRRAHSLCVYLEVLQHVVLKVVTSHAY